MNSRKQAVLDLLWNEPYKIGHWVGFKDLTGLHNTWLRSFLYSHEDQTLLAHRGSYKTTDLSLFLALHAIERPNENVMFFRKTDDDVTEVITQTRKTRIQYMELQNIRNRGGRFINTGTPWHKEDAISLMPNVKRYDCYSTGLITRDKLEELRQSMSDSLFAANYELRHIADKDAMFKEPEFTKDVEKIYGGIVHIDAAYDGADGTAFTIIRKTKDGFIGFGKRWDRHVDDCLNEISVYHKRFRAGTIYCEDNADKGYLRKEIAGMGIPVSGYHEQMNKFVKISTYLRKNWKKIKWLEETDPEYINEILDYSEFAEHDDSPDSAASIFRKLETRAAYNNGLRGGV